ncbi:MAG: ParB N-terminal domain-containing protein [Bacteroidetes Order II. Incertae sedis bacterium]|jgi:ParB-like chromosome segregation protein Spo0J|nr:ParB N-terminal domain-containing protein [Bacteroidetes Order II. bacterium]
MNLELLKTENLKVPDWRTTHILKPNLIGLMKSIEEYGMINPILTMTDGIIIDGFARWVAAQSLGLKKIPVQRRDCGKTEAMMLHIQLNRARGEIVPHRLSKTIRLLSIAMDEQVILNSFNMKTDELDVLLDGSLVKKRKVSEHSYSKAWIPIESNASEDFSIERPPTPDA